MMAVRSARPSARVVVATPMSENAALDGISGGASGADGTETGKGPGVAGSLNGASANGFLERSGSRMGSVGRNCSSRTSGTGPNGPRPPVGRRAVSRPVMLRAAAPVRPRFARIIHRIGTAAAINTRYESLLAGRRAKSVTAPVTTDSLGLRIDRIPRLFDLAKSNANWTIRV